MIRHVTCRMAEQKCMPNSEQILYLYRCSSTLYVFGGREEKEREGERESEREPTYTSVLLQDTLSTTSIDHLLSF